MNKNYIKDNVAFIFYTIICVSGLLLFMYAASRYRLYTWVWLVMENNWEWTAMDYYTPVLWDKNLAEVYNVFPLYPPLTTLFYNYIARATSVCFRDGYGMEIAKELSVTPVHMMIYIGYLAIGISFVTYAISEFKVSKEKKGIISFFTILSLPMFAGALERGNCIIFVIAFLLLAVAWKDSDNKFERELALISIAMAVGLKLYPAVIGLLYIKEKRYKESIRLIIYGIITVFVPFLFTGGINSMIIFFNTMFSRNDLIDIGRIQCFKGLIATLLNDNTNGIIVVLYYAFVGMLLLALMTTKDRLRELAYLAVFMSTVPSNGFRITLLYWLMPLMFLFEKNTVSSIRKAVYAILLAFIFALPAIAGLITKFETIYDLFTLTYAEVAVYIPAWILTFGCIIAGNVELVSRIVKMKHA